MVRSSRTPRSAIPAILVAGWLALAAAPPALAELLINPQGWKFPNIITSAKEAIRVSDRTPLIPGKETIIKGYRKADGTRFMTYEIEGKIFGVEVDTDGKPPFEFSIMDTDGDGKFETKIVHGPGNTDRAYVPQWVIDYYYSLHPELKKPETEARPPSPSLTPANSSPSVAGGEASPRKEPPPPDVADRPNP
jgi:hypothetical protein